MKTIIDKNTGKVLYCREDEPTLENEMAIDLLLTKPIDNPYYDFDTKNFYDKIENDKSKMQIK
jgi:hypothetical protein